MPDRRDSAAKGDLSIGTEKPKRTILTLYSTPAVDPTYTTVLFRVKRDDPDGSFFEVELSASDAQKLGHALNSAGGGVLNGKS